jgi:hypothetical protein
MLEWKNVRMRKFRKCENEGMGKNMLIRWLPLMLFKAMLQTK